MASKGPEGGSSTRGSRGRPQHWTEPSARSPQAKLRTGSESLPNATAANRPGGAPAAKSLASSQQATVPSGRRPHELAAEIPTKVPAGGLLFKGLACEQTGEMFPPLYDADIGWDLWFNTPWTFTVAVVCITVSMRWAHHIGLGTVKAVAYCSLPLQAWWWHGLLVLNECS